MAHIAQWARLRACPLRVISVAHHFRTDPVELVLTTHNRHDYRTIHYYLPVLRRLRFLRRPRKHKASVDGWPESAHRAAALPQCGYRPQEVGFLDCLF